MFADCTWLNAPAAYRMEADALTVTTERATDFWRITSYGFIRDSGHFLGRPVEGDFTAQVHVQGDFQHLYDQAGLMVRVDERRWIKAGVEFSDGALLLSTVLTDERSDWATSLAPALPAGLWLRVTVTAGVIRVQYSADGVVWPLLRLAPFPIASRYLVGPMCCTPERAGLTAVFSAFSVGPALGRDLHDLG